MITINQFFVWVFLPWATVLALGVITMLMLRSWNIPITVLRFTGDKRRPTLIHRKGKKKIYGGVTKLFVKGYKHPVRDYHAENYYPSPRSQWGGLILFEFEDGWLTPLFPRWKKLGAEQQAATTQALRALKKIHDVQFEYEPEAHGELILKIVDDVDADFYVQELGRQDQQYQSGWAGFLQKYMTTISMIFLAILLFVGFVLWIQKQPEIGAACGQAAAESIANKWLVALQNNTGLVPPG